MGFSRQEGGARRLLAQEKGHFSPGQVLFGEKGTADDLTSADLEISD